MKTLIAAILLLVIVIQVMCLWKKQENYGKVCIVNGQSRMIQGDTCP